MFTCTVNGIMSTQFKLNYELEKWNSTKHFYYMLKGFLNPFTYR